ncbi:Bifunctional protein pyrR [compost metagenome]
MNELFDYGRPGRVALAVLADRGGRNLPIAADFAAATIELPQDKTLVLSRQGEGAATRFAFATEARA